MSSTSTLLRAALAMGLLGAAAGPAWATAGDLPHGKKHPHHSHLASHRAHSKIVPAAAARPATAPAVNPAS